MVRAIGPGLLEKVYETVLAGRLEQRGLSVSRQHPVPLTVEGHYFETAFKIDILVNDSLILEIKAVDQLTKANAKQLLTYLRLTQQPLGLLLNFNGETMKEGIRRLVNNHHPA